MITTAAGDSVYHGGVAERLTAQLWTARSTASSAFPHLTPREHDILRLIARGYDNTVIANRLVSVAVLPVTAVASTGALGVDHAAAGILTAAYGIGALAASTAIMIRPLPGDADRAMTILAAGVAAALALVTLTAVFWAALMAYAVAGILNSYFFAATLAARSEYAPGAARGQVFVWIGALKITAGSAGTALAGTVIGAGVHLPLALAVALAVTAAGASLTERVLLTRRRR